ncbi:MAG TPA: MBL fold metallo-hydrolase [Candidatus Acidoferrales bacterium]|nr:MBL fold metallo-hydrolase [Candidatus Acidoferrales bacterium]
MRRILFWIAPLIVLASLATHARAAAEKTLRIYFIDVEGGQSTLLVDPAGEALLIDTGWAGFNGRDADRIEAAAKAAGVHQIDVAVITHYHGDHVGGMPEIAKRMKIATFVDHGADVENSDRTRAGYAAYLQVASGAKRIIAKPGDQLPLRGMRVEVVAAAGQAIQSPVSRGAANPLCASEPEAPVDSSENAQSVGMLITYGNFRFLDLGDLTKRKEKALVCPNNLLGTVDLYLTSHHGLDESNSKAMVDALHPRVAIMNNGAHKGGIPAAWQIVHDSPGLQALWQLHYAVDGGKDHNVADEFIANLGEKDEGNYISVSAQANGIFTVTNSRNHLSKTYSK